MHTLIKLLIVAYLLANAYASGIVIATALDAVSQGRLDQTYEQIIGKRCYGDFAVRRNCT